MKRFAVSDLAELAEGMQRPYHEGYFAMYSSVFDGVVTDPSLMLVPIDDHMVHRGDGIFETLKCVAGNIYNLSGHMTRLENTARELGIALPVTVDVLCRISLDTVRAGEQRDCTIRILVSRGPGSFGVNPYDCPRSQLYIISCAAKAPFMVAHPEGAHGRSSSIPPKAPLLARLKSVDYLPNVLMKKEAVDAGVDFVAGFDADGYLTEGATENIGIVTAERAMVFPKPDAILPGTTMLRAAELAEALMASGALRSVTFRDISRNEILAAAEVVVVGTSWNVTSVTEFDGETIGAGVPGPVATKLNRLLEDDILNNADMQTPVW